MTTTTTDLATPMHSDIYAGPDANPDDIKRLLRQEAAARKNGIALPHPVYSLGHPVVALGRHNFQEKRRAWEELAPWGQVVDSACARIAAEEREDVPVKLSTLGADVDGTIGTSTTRYRLTRPGLGGLMSQMGLPTGISYLEQAPAFLLGQNLEYWFRHRYEGEGDKAREPTRTLRTRRAIGDDGAGMDGAREVYSVTSEKYKPFDADALLRLVRDATPHGARGSFKYDGERMVAKAEWFSSVQPEQVCAGEVFNACLRITARDDRLGKVTLSWGVTRNRCRNLIVLGGAGHSVALRHTDDNMTAKLRAFMSSATAALEDFAGEWTQARLETVLGGSLYAPETIFRGLVREDLVRMPGYSEDEAVNALMMAWHAEPGNTKADILNAITRTAHTSTWKDEWAGEGVEEQAGELLYQHVGWGHVAEVGAAEAN